jgi:ABC-type transport system involved in cytochrome c biogenesis permease subunit
MTIGEGETVNFVELSRKMELALTDTSNPDFDEVVTIPGSMLREGTTIRDERLPVDIEVVEFMPNSQIERVEGQPGPRGVRTSLAGHLWTIRPATPGSGVEANQREDAPAARITLRRKDSGEALGTYLVSHWFSPNFVLRQRILQFPPQVASIDGKNYTFELRPERVVKPYALKLYEFRHDKYLGTDTPKNFSSRVSVIDPEHGPDREVVISMNAPLRRFDLMDEASQWSALSYLKLLVSNGDTLYQSSFLPPELAGQRGTVLQVVRNPGWLLPYIACSLVAIGMLVHFGIKLVGFLSVSRSYAVPTGFVWPAAIGIAMCALVGLRVFWPESTVQGLDRAAFGRLPVVEGGRVKPLDTVARTSLLMISEKQSFNDDNETSQPAIQWLIDVWGNDDPFDGPGAKHKVFRIVDLELLSRLELPQRPLFWRYSLEELKRGYDKFERELERAHATDESKRTPYDRAVLDLGNRLRVYEQLARRKTPLAIPPRNAGEDWRSVSDADAAIVKPVIGQIQDQVREQVIEKLAKDRIDFRSLTEEQRTGLRAYLQKATDLRAAEYASAHRAKSEPAAAALVAAFEAARGNDALKANRLLAEYRAEHIGPWSPADAGRVETEFRFNRLQPFFLFTVQYVLVFVLAGLSWAGWTVPLRRAALGLLIGTVILHTVALGVRMYLMDRPFVFVTNLYSSAIFIGWASAILGLIIELIYRNGVGSALAAVAGSLSLVVAHFLGLDGDQLQMLQAVLDTNFWLATHVTTVTLGYSATYMAGLFGVAYIAVRLIGQNRSPLVLKSLSQIVYGVLCFATLMSFVGTVLGGIWADQSWGRFWGWDPKENGALMIVIWNALILHARWAGMVKQRGVAVLAVMGCIVTTWSWFGTNQLGVGLHSYGFTSGRTLAIIFTSLTFAGLGLLGLIPVASIPTVRKAPAT